jgi:hypothetical protein
MLFNTIDAALLFVLSDAVEMVMAEALALAGIENAEQIATALAKSGLALKKTYRDAPPAEPITPEEFARRQKLLSEMAKNMDGPWPR